MGEGSVGIRRARAGDMAFIVELWQKMMDELSAVDGRYALKPGADILWAKWVGLRLRDSGSCVIVAEKDGRYVGYLVAHTDESHPIFRDRVHGLVTDIYVEPELRRRGTGRRLVEEAAAFFRGLGVAELRMNVLARAEQARGFLQKLGFGEFTHRVVKRLDVPPGRAAEGGTGGRESSGETCGGGALTHGPSAS
jgi:GNAT superfamily N-acetyltransferase